MKITVPNQTAKEIEIARQGLDLSEQAGRAVIASDEDNAKAATLLSMIKAAFKQAEVERKALTDPLNAVIKNINQRYKSTVTGPLEQAEATIKGKMLEWMQAKRRAEEAAAEAARQKAERARSESSKAKHEIAAEIAQQRAAEAFKVAGVYGGSASVRKRWTFEVIDPLSIPREYLEVNEQAVRESIRQGVRNIEGLRIFEEESVAAR